MSQTAETRLRRMRLHARRLNGMADHWRPGQRAPWFSAVVGPRRNLRLWSRFPADDVIDKVTGAQFFVHRHDIQSHGYAHFHCFVRQPGGRHGLQRKAVTTHIAAIAVDRQGKPIKIIVLNQWVTDEFWQNARHTLALLEKFRFQTRTPHGRAGNWLESVLHVHWPELRKLLKVRDQRLQRCLSLHPDINVLQDRRLEILGSVNIDLRKRLRLLGAA